MGIQPFYGMSAPHLCCFLQKYVNYVNEITVQILKILIMKFSAAFCHFLPLMCKYHPQHPFLKNPRSITNYMEVSCS
jgi:hypothetical protein